MYVNKFCFFCNVLLIIRPVLVVYKVTIPEHSSTGDPLPPSYPPLPIQSRLGQGASFGNNSSASSIRFKYFLCISLQTTVSSTPKALEIPIRILSPLSSSILF